MVRKENGSGEMPVADRMIFLVFLILAFAPMIYPLGLPIPITPLVTEAFQAVEDVPEGGVVLITENNAFGTLVEIGPAETAFLRHVFEKMEEKNVRVIVYSGSIQGNQISQNILKDYVDRPDPFTDDPSYGKLWVHLGAILGGEAVTAGMVSDMIATAPMDLYGTPTKDMEIFEYIAARAAPYDIITGDDINLFMVVHNSSSDPWARQWGKYGDPQRGFPNGNQIMITGSAQMASSQVFVTAGQIRSLISGQRAGAEYEQLLKRPGLAASTMDAQNFAHLFGIGLIFVANIGYFYKKWKGEAE